MHATILTIAVLENDRDRLFLNGGRFFKALLKDSHEEFPLEEEILKVSALGLSDILGLVAGVFCGGDEAVFVGARSAYLVSVFW